MSASTLPRCRICLNLLDILSTSHPIVDIKEKLFFVTGIVAHSEQPQRSCQNCVNELENAFKFKKKCEETEKQLLQEKIKLEIALNDFENRSTVEEIFNEVSQEAIKKEEEEQLKTHSDENESKKNFRNLQKKNKNVQCEICGNFYLNFSSLKTHYSKLHNNIKPYCCKRCKINFNIKAQLDDHDLKCEPKIVEKNEFSEQKISGKDFASCNICNNVFKVRYLKRHLSEVHGKQSKELTCDLCGEKFKGKPGIVEHMKRRHIWSNKYQCSFCTTTFPIAGMKKNHEIRYHTLKFSHQCGICDLKFISSVEYRNHFATHTGEKSYNCFHCGKQFARKQNLKLHVMIHSDQRLFKCETCGSDFKTSARLKVHENSHKEKMYECPVPECRKMFVVNQTLRNHLQKRHPTFQLPPPGTIMNKKSLEKILSLAKHLKMKVNEGKLSLPQLYETVGIDMLNAKSLLRTTIV